MPRSCSVCSDSRRALVDQALVGGVAVDEISRRYPPLSATSIRRHRAEHIPQAVAKAAEEEEVRQGLDVLGQLKAINSATFRILHEARNTGDPNTALRAIDRIQKQIELQAKLLGDLDERASINVLVTSPQWVETRGALITALKPFPEARQAVVAKLLELEATNESRG